MGHGTETTRDAGRGEAERPAVRDGRDARDRGAGASAAGASGHGGGSGEGGAAETVAELRARTLAAASTAAGTAATTLRRVARDARSGAQLAARRVEEGVGRRAEALRAAEGDVDWGRVGVFGMGIAVGALLGAGVALLAAPAAGEVTRERLVRQARRARVRAADRVEDLADSVRFGTRRGGLKARRALVRSRWLAEDAWDRRR